jgi:membrane-associated protease RseP (regulator of RpoE activity)
VIKHIVLFILTVISTAFVGGAFYSLSIMSILLAHEMGHYFMSRKYNISTTLPFFIPFPFSPFGTFGAVIKMRGVIVNKNALFDIGTAGPLSGFLVSLPCIFIGIKLSTIQKVTTSVSTIRLGDPLLFKLLEWLMVGPLPPNHDLVLHPIGYAGWVGLFVTALNLLPVGQLDGGHIIYAVFGERSKWAYGASIIALIVMAVFLNVGWVALLILLLIFGMRHPEPFDSITPLDLKRKILAVGMLLVFVLSFIPTPFPDLMKAVLGG